MAALTNRPRMRTTSRTKSSRRSPTSNPSKGSGPVHSRPAHQERAHGETGPDGGEEREVALLQPRVVEGGGQGERDRGRRRVAGALDVLDHLRFREVEAVAHRVDDAQVVLVGDEEVELLRLQAVALQEREARLRERPHRVLEDV